MPVVSGSVSRPAVGQRHQLWTQLRSPAVAGSEEHEVDLLSPTGPQPEGVGRGVVRLKPAAQASPGLEAVHWTEDIQTNPHWLPLAAPAQATAAATRRQRCKRP